MFGNPCSAVARGPFPDAPLSDMDIRRAIVSDDSPVDIWSGDHVLEEVRIWRGHVRADFVISSLRSIEVVEIKSDLDTLRRFEEQVRVYSSFADRVVLVVGWALAARALRAAPWWWEVWLAERPHDGSTALVPIREGFGNPAAQPASLARMLPIEEARKAVASAGLHRRALTMRSTELRQTLAERMSLTELRALVAAWLGQLAQRRVARAGSHPLAAGPARCASSDATPG